MDGPPPELIDALRGLAAHLDVPAAHEVQEASADRAVRSVGIARDPDGAWVLEVTLADVPAEAPLVGPVHPTGSARPAPAPLPQETVLALVPAHIRARVRFVRGPALTALGAVPPGGEA